jgi:hypothetical protein
MPDLRVVSERSEQEIKKQEATAALKQALIALTANLIRIVRGAGKPDFIAEHIRDLAVAYANYCDIDERGVRADIINDMLPAAAPDQLAALGNFLREHNPPPGHVRIIEYLRGLLTAAQRELAEHQRFSTARGAELDAEIATLKKNLDTFEKLGNIELALSEATAERNQAKIDADAAAAMRKRVESSLRAAGALPEAR